MSRPNVTDYATFYETYVSLVPEDDVLQAMKSQTDELFPFLRGITEQVACLRHPPYTWSVKEVIGHLIDAERVFAYRALRFARNDATPLAGFDENNYMQAAEFDRYLFRDLAEEFESLRRSNLLFFNNLPATAWSRIGVASENKVTVNALAYIIVGHVRHHTAILRKRLSGDNRS